MKKIISKILIAAFIFNIFGVPFAFKVVQINIKYEVRREIKAGANDNELEIIFADDEFIHWIFRGKEFRYKDEMYDVVKSKVIDNKKYYYCICDKKEKDLINQYNKTNSSKTENIIKNIKTILLFFDGIPNLLNFVFFNYIIYNYLINLIENYIVIPSPPPKII